MVHQIPSISVWHIQCIPDTSELRKFTDDVMAVENKVQRVLSKRLQNKSPDNDYRFYQRFTIKLIISFQHDLNSKRHDYRMFNSLCRNYADDKQDIMQHRCCRNFTSGGASEKSALTKGQVKKYAYQQENRVIPDSKL